MKKKQFSEEDISRIIEMAWEDRTPFEKIFIQFKINEKELISIMRNSLKESSFKLWRKRVKNRKTKHPKKYDLNIERHYAPTQYKKKKKN